MLAGTKFWLVQPCCLNQITHHMSGEYECNKSLSKRLTTIWTSTNHTHVHCSLPCNYSSKYFNLALLVPFTTHSGNFDNNNNNNKKNIEKRKNILMISKSKVEHSTSIFQCFLFGIQKRCKIGIEILTSIWHPNFDCARWVYTMKLRRPWLLPC